MRTNSAFIAAVTAALLLPTLALADDATGGQKKKLDVSCTIDADKDDLVAQNRDLILEPDTKAKDAVVLHGNVTVRKGATVQKVVALDGDVLLEPGARVQGDVVALGGNIRIQAGAEVGGDVTALGGHAEVAPSAKVKGHRVAVGGLEINGEDVAQKLIKEAISKEHHCRVARK